MSFSMYKTGLYLQHKIIAHIPLIEAMDVVYLRQLSAGKDGKRAHVEIRMAIAFVRGYRILQMRRQDT